VTGEADKPQERGGYPVNAGAPPAGADRLLFGLPAIWLRVNCPCSMCRDPRTGERLTSITDVPYDASVVTARQVGDRVEVVFGPDGHSAAFDIAWLRQFAMEEDQSGGVAADGGPGAGALDGEDARTEDAKRLWSADDIMRAFPQGSWPLFRAEAAHQQACLSAVMRDGFVVLRDVPREPGSVLSVAQSIGLVRATTSGPLVDVHASAWPASQANTGRPLTPRTTQPFRDPMPTLEVVHCLDDAAQGGESVLVDGFHAAALLRAKDPAAFEVLASSEVTYAYASARAEFRATRPVIGVDQRGRIREIRLNNSHMQPLRLPPGQAVSFYAAYRAFAEMTRWQDQTLTFGLRPGDCLILDNTRILAGRTGFTDDGKRRMQVCWTDLDVLASTLALIRRPRTNGHLPTLWLGPAHRAARCLSRRPGSASPRPRTPARCQPRPHPPPHPPSRSAIRSARMLVRRIRARYHSCSCSKRHACSTN
jgi:gamma-butyrobetaine dioxygenase